MNYTTLYPSGFVSASVRELDRTRTPYIVVTAHTALGFPTTAILSDTRCSLARRIDAVLMPFAVAVDKAITFAIYHYIERPIKRMARKIAMSGHWSY